MRAIALDPSQRSQRSQRPQRPQPVGATAFGRLLLWCLACLVPLQGTAAGVITTLGMQHGHRVAAEPGPRLVDFRRELPQRARPAHVGAGIGHFHATETPQRHVHAPGDKSVVPVQGTAVQSLAEADDPSVSPTLGAFVALLPCTPSPVLAPTRSGPARCQAWRPSTRAPPPLERPPKGS